MKPLPLLRFLLLSLLTLCCARPVAAQHPPTAPDPAARNVYAPYEPLIGDWEVMQPGMPPFMVMHFKWAGGPRGYILYNASFLKDGEEETHFEGMLIWNAVNRNLDMLLTLDPINGATQEKGTVSVEPDGTIVRAIVATGPHSARGADGKPTTGSANFRQTFHPVTSDEMKTVVLRETNKGWVPTFPGGDNLVMRRRAPAGHAR